MVCNQSTIADAISKEVERLEDIVEKMVVNKYHLIRTAGSTRMCHGKYFVLKSRQQLNKRKFPIEQISAQVPNKPLKNFYKNFLRKCRWKTSSI